MYIYIYSYLKNEFEKGLLKLNRNEKKTYRGQCETSN